MDGLPPKAAASGVVAPNGSSGEQDWSCFLASVTSTSALGRAPGAAARLCSAVIAPCTARVVGEVDPAWRPVRSRRSSSGLAPAGRSTKGTASALYMVGSQLGPNDMHVPTGGWHMSPGIPPGQGLPGSGQSTWLTEHSPTAAQ